MTRRSSRDTRASPLRRLVIPVYAPAAIFSLGWGAVTPTIAVAADELGASLWLAGLVAGLPVVGMLAADVPAGAVVSRLGERGAMRLSAVLSVVSAAAVVLSGDLRVLAVASLLQGISISMFELARHALITHVVPAPYRGRALGMLAGMARVGISIGPLLTAGLIAEFGVLSAYWVQVGAGVTVIAVLAVVGDPPRPGVAAPRHDADARGVFRSNAGLFLRLGTGVGALMMLRMSRQIIVPLWGVGIGVSPSHIALAVGVSGLMELALFYTGGQIADRFGRMWVVVPVVTALALGHIALLAAHDLPSFYAVAIVLGLANAFSGGIMMTLGSDLAPDHGTAEFLGAWRLFADAGGAMAPLVITLGAAAGALGASAVALGALGFVGSATLYHNLPRYLRDRRA